MDPQWPDGVTLVTIRHRPVTTGGRTLGGNMVTAVASERLWTDDGSILPAEASTRIAADGSWEITLPAVDAGLRPAGAAYRLTEHVPGAQDRHVWVAPLSHHAPGPVDLVDVLSPQPKPGGGVTFQTGPATDPSMAQIAEDPDSEFRASLMGTIGTETEALVPPLVAQAIADDDTITQAAAAAAVPAVEQVALDIGISGVGRDHDVRVYGASTAATWQENRDAFQAANDAARAEGGGRVVIPPGRWNVAEVFQDSRVELYGPGATLAAPDTDTSTVINARIPGVGATITGDTLALSRAEPVEPGCALIIRYVGGINQTQNTYLTAPLAADATALPVASTYRFPTAGVLRLGDELLEYAGLTDTSFTGVTRGAHGTTPAAHAPASVIGQASVHYTEALSVDGTTVTIAEPAPIAGTVAATVQYGSLYPKITGLSIEGGRYGVQWEGARWGTMTDVTVRGSGHGAVQLLHGACDNRLVNVTGRTIGNPTQGTGAGLWIFRGCHRNRVINPTITGVGYHGIYIDDRTRVGSEWDAPCNDNTIENPTITIPRYDPNTGVMIVNGNGNQVRGGSISGVRTGVLVDSNQVHRHDGALVAASGNLVDGVSITGTFHGVGFRQPGNRAMNVPTRDVDFPIAYEEQPGNSYQAIGDGFGTEQPPTPVTRGSLWLAGNDYHTYPSTPYAADLEVTGDLEVIALVRPEDWYQAAGQHVASKWGNLSERVWAVQLLNGNLTLALYNTAAVGHNLIAPLPAGLTGWGWVRVVADIDDGAGGAKFTAYHAPADDAGDEVPLSWTELGTQQIAEVITPAFGPRPQTIGGSAAASSNHYRGGVARVLERIGATTVVDVDFSDLDATKPGVDGLVVPDGTGKREWTLRGTTWEVRTT